MSENHIRNVIEAALLAGGKPLQVAEIAQLFDEEARPEKEQIVEGLRALETEYADRGIELKETASGWRVQIRTAYGREIGRLWPERAQKYSRALLETLALVAYRQPITRAEIESVRGVAVNPNIIKTLMERDWVRVVGHRDVPGHPELLGTARTASARRRVGRTRARGGRRCRRRRGCRFAGERTAARGAAGPGR